MAFLKNACSRFPLTADIISACHPFSCGDKDLDEFFCRDIDSDFAFVMAYEPV